MRNFLMGMMMLTAVVVGIPGTIVVLSFGAGWLDAHDRSASSIVCVTTDRGNVVCGQENR